jgi:signal transduction histidine kinase
LVAILISALMYRAGVDALVERERATLENSVNAATTRFLGRMEIARRDVVFLSRLPVARRLTEEIAAAGHRDQLAETFVALLPGRPDYLRLRYVEADGGRVVVAVERTPSGAIEQTSAGNGPAQAGQPWFAGSLTLPAGGIYVSSPHVDRGFDPIEGPRQPVINVATPLYDPAGRAIGIVVIDVSASYLFGLIAEVLGPATEFVIVNEDGDYLVGSGTERSLGLDRSPRRQILDDIPDLASFLAGQPDGFTGFVRRSAATDLAVAGRIAYNPREPGRFLVLAAFVPEALILGRIAAERGDVALLALGVILIAAVFAVVLALRIVRPLRGMTEAASRIARGEHGPDLAAFTERRDETGALARAFDAMMREVDEREARLTAQAAELTRSNQDLAQFAYIASHDLQEPLRMVASYLGLLERRYAGQLDDDAREFIGYAVDGATRMKQLINDLLDYSRAGSAPLRMRNVDTGELVAGVLRTLSIRIADVHGHVAVEGLPTVAADATQLARVFQNLIDNALKYRSRAAPRVRVIAESIDGFWKFSVRDNGIGVDPRFADRVFEIFKRLHGRDKYTGTGIGLAICKLVVERHGGRIWVEDRPQGGSVFCFTVPR